MYQYEDLRHLHLEPTTRCNAACPMCARNVRGRRAPGLPAAELGSKDVAEMFPPSFVGRLEAIDLCGAYGDPALARGLMQIVEYFRASLQGRITLYTNGGIQSTGWWRALARTLGRDSLVVFAIDGLADTNSIHRIRVDFEKVVDNAKAFVDAGGNARWEYLVFRHNAHQIEAARTLAGEIGFSEFSVKRSDRFLEPFYEHVPEVEGAPDPLSFPIYDARGKVTGALQPAEETGLANPVIGALHGILEKWGSLDAVFDHTPIRCKVLDTKSVFVSATGYAFPCCWTYVQATRPGVQGYPQRADLSVHNLVLASGGYESLDVRKRGLKEAVESTFFKAVADSWGCSSVKEGRIKVCARACGDAFPAYASQFVDAGLLPRGLRDKRANDER